MLYSGELRTLGQMKVLIGALSCLALLTGCAPELTHPEENSAREKTSKLCLEHGGEIANMWGRWGGNFGCIICVMPGQGQPPVWNDYCDTEDLTHALGDDFDVSNRGEFPKPGIGIYGQKIPSNNEQKVYVEIPEFRSVAILRSEDILSLEQLNEGNQKILDAALSGATAGSAAGLAAGLIICGTTGPLAGLCITGLSSAGLLTGGAGGAIYGATTSNNGDEAGSVNKNLALV